MKGFRPTGNGPKAGHSFPTTHGFTASRGGHVVKSHMRAAPRKNPAAQQGAKLQALAGLLAATQGGAGGPPPGGPPGMAGPPPGMAGPQVPGAPMGGLAQVPGATMRRGGKVAKYAMGGKTGNYVGSNIPQDAPRGKPEFQDFRKGGRAKRVKKSAGGIIINRPR